MDGIPVTVTCRAFKLAGQPCYRRLGHPVTYAVLEVAHRATRCSMPVGDTRSSATPSMPMRPAARGLPGPTGPRGGSACPPSSTPAPSACSEPGPSSMPQQGQLSPSGHWAAPQQRNDAPSSTTHRSPTCSPLNAAPPNHSPAPPRSPPLTPDGKHTNAAPCPCVLESPGLRRTRLCTHWPRSAARRRTPADWPLDRNPLLLETGVRGVFAAGDVRAHSIKRVASGLGEGAMAVALIHRHRASSGQWQGP